MITAATRTSLNSNSSWLKPLGGVTETMRVNTEQNPKLISASTSRAVSGEFGNLPKIAETIVVKNACNERHDDTIDKTTR